MLAIIIINYIIGLASNIENYNSHYCISYIAIVLYVAIWLAMCS